MIPRRRFLAFFPALPFLRPAKRSPPLPSMKDWDAKMAALKAQIEKLEDATNKLKEMRKRSSYQLLELAHSVQDSQYCVVTTRETS